MTTSRITSLGVTDQGAWLLLAFEIVTGIPNVSSYALPMRSALEALYRVRGYYG